MRLPSVIFVVVALAVAPSARAEDETDFSTHGAQGITVKCDTQWKHSYVRSFEHTPGFDFLRIERNFESPIKVLVAADQLDMFKNALKENDIAYEVTIEDVSAMVDEELAQQEMARSSRSNDVDVFASFPRYYEIKAYLEYLAKTRSDLVELVTIGKSFEGREIVGVKLSIGGAGQNKPAVLIDAGIHAREWAAPTTAIYAIHQLAENATNRYLLENVDVYVIPFLNPDGYEYTHQSKNTRMWRKTRSRRPELGCIGVDANRNFDYKWMTVGASSSPCSDTYAGPKAFSEPETAALRDFMLNIKNIKVYLTLHSYGQYLLHPWGYTSALPANEPTLRCVAEKAEAALSAVRGTRYTIGSSTNVLYAAAGGSDDWAMAVGNAELAYTIELPSAEFGFAPPPKEIVPIGKETFEAFKEFIRYAATGRC